ncbi:AraC family transcriptional regulator [Lacinutrix sp. C3R15]|uniref:helix-turn-helix domain-containing protein n=1 Tax=Flavobacteriaceae TaxID=49546 RepID=UPI001C09C0B8|nr:MULTISPECIES: AraC family transcriptional regulator [Flavobacteriaceae]MBU2939830.1 AraC family transcriptional regulator [Lacinutrix sp. C3R15]MDO6623146.1 AraC family transcriptional regulator [Oceanihabitans sp. 1_MG-2023]
MKIAKNVSLGDPSSNFQNFIDLKLKLLCCRYWLLDLWDCHDMVFPYWRIYWNKNEGGELIHNDKITTMRPDMLYIIPPFTSFSSRFAKHHIYKTGIHVSGNHLTNTIDESKYEEKSLIHFFTHFNLGVPFDNVYPRIIEIELTDYLKERLIYLTERLKIENTDFKLTFNLKLQAFIKETLTNIGPELWKTINMDDRVLKVIRFVEMNVNKKLSNAEIADVVNMASNSFARLFKQEMNISVHNFIQNRKIAKACDLFEHSNNTIEEVAFNLGFSDRYHFSRVFKSVTGLTPAVYKSGKYT